MSPFFPSLVEFKFKSRGRCVNGRVWLVMISLIGVTKFNGETVGV